MQYPELASVTPVPTDFENCVKEGYPLLFNLHTHAASLTNISSVVLLERFRGLSDEKALLKLMEWEIAGVENEKQRQAVYSDAINNMQHQLHTLLSSERLVELEAKSKTGLSAEEKAEYLSLISS